MVQAMPRIVVLQLGLLFLSSSGGEEIIFKGDASFSPGSDYGTISLSAFQWELTTHKWPCRVWRANVSVQDPDGIDKYFVAPTHPDAMPDCDGPKDAHEVIPPSESVTFCFRHQWRKRVLQSLQITRECVNCDNPGNITVTVSVSCPKPCPSALGHRGGLPPHAPSQFLKLGAVEGAEVDTQVTSDKVLVLHHDARLGSTLSGDGRLCEKTLDELKALPMVHKNALESDRIMTLEEGLLIAKQEGFMISVDAKAGCRLYGHGGRTCAGPGCCMEAPKCPWVGPGKDWGYPELASAYLEATYATGTERQCYFASFDADLNLAIHNQDEAAMIMWLPSPGRNSAEKVRAWLLEMGVNMTDDHSFGISVEKNSHNFSPEAIHQARDEGFFFDIYTVTNSDMGKFIRQGPDTLETDHPLRLEEEVRKICPFRESESKAIEFSIHICPSAGGLQCSNRGQCNSGVCSCEKGYEGSACEVDRFE